MALVATRAISSDRGSHLLLEEPQMLTAEVRAPLVGSAVPGDSSVPAVRVLTLLVVGHALWIGGWPTLIDMA